jgi:peptide/nickel transport system substrate-binding protein
MMRGRVEQLSACLLVAACAGADSPAVSSDASRIGGTVVIVAADDLDAANSLVTQNRYAQELVRDALFLPLIRYGPRLELEPALARSWELTGDTGAIFTLRDDVLWHDSARTTAFDVEFTFDRAKDPATRFPGAADFARWTDAEVLDSFSVRFRWDPHADALAALPFLPIMPRHVLDTVPADGMARTPFNRNPVGNGPFRFVEYIANDRWVFAANTDFPQELGGRPYIDRLVWRIVPDNTAQVTELQTGNADLVLNPRAEVWHELGSDTRVRRIERPSRNYAFIGWNGRRPPLDDPRVRRALAMAIDRQQIIDLLRGGSGTVAAGPVGPYHWGFDASVAPLPYDTAAARALLAEAGIRDANGDGTFDGADGRPFGFELKYAAESALNRDMAELIRTQLAAFGVQVRLTSIEQNTLIGQMTSSGREFEAVLFGWASQFRLDLSALFHSRNLAGPFQIAGYSNPVVDSLIDATEHTLDREQARPLISRLQTILRDEQPWTQLYYYSDLYLASARLQGADMDIRSAFVNLPRWWIDRSAQ